MKVEENNNNNYYLCYAHLISLGDSKTWCYGVFIPSLTNSLDHVPPSISVQPS